MITFPSLPFSDYKMDVYYMGGGPETPVGSTYLGCHADNRSDRLFKDAFLWCESSMTLQVRHEID